jgi:hypothetical protein
MPNWKKLIVSGSDAALNSLTVSSGITGSLLGTASYALNGGVTQLLAGSNITLSPINGLGQVTITSTLSGSNTYNTATGSYGSFYDTTIQTNPVANVPRSMSFDNTDITNGVSISGSISPFNTYIKIENPGVYNIQFSAQVEKTDSGTDEIIIWLRKNGIDLTDSATQLTLTGNGTKVVAAWNWFVTSAANDYYQIIWSSADTGMRLYAEPAGGIPGIPSVILTVNRIDQFLSNTGSFSGSFIGEFTGSLLGTASYALTASYLDNYLPPFPYTGSAQITGSLGVTGSFANGFQVRASGSFSHAGGAFTQANGLYSHAEGVYTIASGGGSHAEGAYTQANGLYSHAEGYDTQANGDRSHAEGVYTIANGYASHAEGYYTTANGNYSHAEGASTQTNGAYSHAEGYYTTASGEASHAEGSNTVASGQSSHAEGSGSLANGPYSHAEGGNIIIYPTPVIDITTLTSITINNLGAPRQVVSSNQYSVTVTGNRVGNYAPYPCTVNSLELYDAENYIDVNLAYYHGSTPLIITSASFNSGTNRTTFVFNGLNATYQNVDLVTGPIANGFASHAEGSGTGANGDYSHAEGASTQEN